MGFMTSEADLSAYQYKKIGTDKSAYGVLQTERDLNTMRHELRRRLRKGNTFRNLPDLLPACLAGTLILMVTLTIVVTVLDKDDGKSSRIRHSLEAAFRRTPVEETIGKFVYVYEFGTEFTDDILNMRPSWYSVQYDGEKFLADLLRRSDMYRTVNPADASLFLVPFYGAWYLNSMYKDYESNMEAAVRNTSMVWDRLIKRVRTEFPHFNKTNGKDHFGILSMDHGRCSAHTFMDPASLGEMFFITLNGDKMVRSTHVTGKRGLQALSYNYNIRPVSTVPDIPCYKPDRDIVAPPVAHVLQVSPFYQERNITLLARFSPGQHHGVPIPHHGHLIRKELTELFEKEKVPGWDYGVRSEDQTDPEWKRAIFCAAPPGHSQWTSRPMKAILSGCIPVTFYREHDNPFQDVINYNSFSVNIDPDQIHTLKSRLDAIMSSPARVLKMQNAVLSVQSYFKWSGNLDEGVERYLLEKLYRRGKELKRELNNNSSVFASRESL